MYAKRSLMLRRSSSYSFLALTSTLLAHADLAEVVEHARVFELLQVRRT